MQDQSTGSNLDLNCRVPCLWKKAVVGWRSDPWELGILWAPQMVLDGDPKIVENSTLQALYFQNNTPLGYGDGFYHRSKSGQMLCSRYWCNFVGRKTNKKMRGVPCFGSVVIHGFYMPTKWTLNKSWQSVNHIIAMGRIGEQDVEFKKAGLCVQF